jgi:hypothetical protein
MAPTTCSSTTDFLHSFSYQFFFLSEPESTIGANFAITILIPPGGDIFVS